MTPAPVYSGASDASDMDGRTENVGDTAESVDGTMLGAADGVSDEKAPYGDASVSSDAPIGVPPLVVAWEAGAGEDAADCGSTGTLENCETCGRSCDTKHSVNATCSGGACLFGGCLPGWSDCDSASTNANGCECETPACCSGGVCQTAHSNGVAQTFFDCVPLGTHTEAQAMAACTAFTGNTSLCVEAPFGACGSGREVCSNNARTCQCWQYAGKASGTVETRIGIVCRTACPTGQGPMWN